MMEKKKRRKKMERGKEFKSFSSLPWEEPQ
jgi:hypothetical protein